MPNVPAMIPLPAPTVTEMNMMIHRFQTDHQEYSNRSAYDEGERWEWVRFLGEVYAAGWTDGRRTQAELDRYRAPEPKET